MQCDLYSIFLYVVAPIIVSEVVAILWIQYLDPEWNGLESKLDLSAMQQLNLIIGFLYVGLIRNAREKWQRIVKLVNEFVITAGTLVQYDPNFKEEIRDLNSMLTTYLSENKKINHIEQLKRLTKQVYVTIKKAKEKDSITQGLSMQLKSVVESLDRHFFEGEPWLFKWHLRILLILYFGSIPAQLFNAYGDVGTLVLYPIIIYFLFSVVLWSNAFGSPLDHPELMPRFKKLQDSFNTYMYETYRDSRQGGLRYD